MTTIAFIGLGIMGRPMAENLVGAGLDVVGFNRSSPAMERLVEVGGRRASSIAEAVAGADIVATMLPDTPDVVTVLTGPDGVFAHARPGTIVVDFSTIRPEASALLAEAGAAASFRVLDAPVSGGEQGAIDGALSVMVGGSAADFAAAAELFEPVSSTLVHVGPAGSGQIVKAANQLIVAGTLSLVAEALVFLEAHGVETEAAVRVLGGGLAGSTVLARKSGQMLARDFTPGFRVELHHKDMGIMMDAARAAGVATPLSALSAQLLATLVARGDGALDHSALFALIGELSGRPAAS
jgi:2-hydroxy-3-oxopropionate reductase